MLKRKAKYFIKICVVIISFCIVLLLVCYTGCFYKSYSGNNADLYTVAINSLLWNAGHSCGADRKTDSDIKILEMDDFGRTLFTYHEKYYNGGTLTISALLICQYSTDDYVYYYEDTNYFVNEQEKHSRQFQNFKQEDIDYLKEANDWGKEIDFNKCTKKDLGRNKENIPTDVNSIKDKVITQFDMNEDSNDIYLYYLTSDIEKKYIIYGSLVNSNSDKYFVGFVNCDHIVVDWLVPDSLYNYQEELRSFKQKNGWISIT